MKRKQDFFGGMPFENSIVKDKILPEDSKTLCFDLLPIGNHGDWFVFTLKDYGKYRKVRKFLQPLIDNGYLRKRQKKNNSM